MSHHDLSDRVYFCVPPAARNGRQEHFTHRRGMTFEPSADPLRTRTCSRDTRTHAKTRQIHIANICGRRGSRADRILHSACSAAVSSQNIALRRRTPRARAASPKQRAPPETTRTQSTNAHCECIPVALGAGDAISRPGTPERLMKSRHQSTGASSRWTSAKTCAPLEIEHAQTTNAYHLRFGAARGAGNAKHARTCRVQICRFVSCNGHFGHFKDKSVCQD